MSARLCVLLVDDHAVVREGYRRLLESRGDIFVVGEAASAAEAYQSFCALQPDVVVMDISLPDASGIEAMRRILSRDRQARVLVFSMHEDAIFPARAIEAGASGYITKASAPEILVDAVHAVAAGKRYLSHDVAQTLALRTSTDDDTALRSLSLREFEVLRLLVRGAPLADIAQGLGISAKTVANHQSSIRQKLGATTGAQLILAAQRLGMHASSSAIP